MPTSLSIFPSRAITTLHIATPSTVELPRTATNDLERPQVAVSLPDSAISATNAAVTGGSVPIATSTPVNPAAGPLSPPPLTLATTGQGPHPHEHPPGAAPTVKVTSYPAVLKGRSAASPPNPNLVPSGKVPPPVPPRGTGPSRTGRSSEEHRTAGATASTTSSVTSSRGDEAAIITRYRLHDSSCDLHPLPPDHSSTSATTAKTVTSTITAATSTKTIAISNALHARTSTLDTNRVTHHDNFDRETGSDDRPMDWDLKEEFVSVEKVEDAYFIRTSPYPFRPDRGIYRSDRWKEFGEAENRKVSKKDKERRDSKADHLAKFTYFLNPGSRSDLMDYKMSRKDKKHSETYYERMKRKQRNLEASITTITTLSYRHKSMEDAKATAASSYAKNKSVEESVKQKISRFAKKDSILLQKIREKARRKKRLAPKQQISATFNGSFDEIEKIKEKREDKRSSSKIDSQANKNDNYRTRTKNDTKNIKGKRKQSASRCDKSFGIEDCSTRSSNYLGDKNISRIINDRQGNKRSGFEGIFPKGNRVEDEDERKIVRERISNFDRQADERLRKYSSEIEVTFSSNKNSDRSSLFREKRPLNEDVRKNNAKDVNRDKLLNITKSETLVSSSLDNIRNRNVMRSSVSEKIKSFEKIKAKGEARNPQQEELYLYNLNEGVNVIKQKFAPSINKTRLNREEEKIGSKAEILNAKHERFKSLSSGNDLPFNSQEFGMLKPNVSFLHTYRKTRSFT